ncbi:MAG: T9SS type A sorting domain-containing protein [Saprospiraceae bacterium]|nr:T9SS type A sorting domain-containing protein [Saprospiraceae bacterium]
MGIIFSLVFMLAQSCGYGQFVIQDTKYIHHVFKHVENYDGYDGHLTLDVNGDGVWDMAFEGLTTLNKDYPKLNSGQLYVGNRNPLFKVCRYGPSGNVLVPYYIGDICYCLADTLSWKSKKFDNNNPAIGSISNGGGPMAWTKLDNAYAFFILESSPGVIDTGWVRFTSHVWVSGFSVTVHSIGTNTPGWKPSWLFFKEEPKPIKSGFPDQDFTFLMPLEDTIVVPEDTLVVPEDTVIVEPPVASDSLVGVFPNPFSDLLYVNLLKIQDPISIELYDDQGRFMLEHPATKASIIEIPVAHLASGWVIVRVNRVLHPPIILRAVHIDRKE